MFDSNEIASRLLEEISSSTTPKEILSSPELRALYGSIKSAEPEQRAELGKRINDLKQQLQSAVTAREAELESASVTSIDVSAPWDINTPESDRPHLLPSDSGSVHPLTTELSRIIRIFTSMGFEAIESRQLDDDYHMFETLNFPVGHPARDGYDTFRTTEGLIAPAHTSTMQHRILKNGAEGLKSGRTIASISYGRVFRNEDVDATHEHTFYQVEGVYVSKTASLSQMLATLQSFFETYYEQKLNIRTQPAHFPFVEPGLEFLIEKPASLGGNGSDWLEMLGCGMIHPNVLSMAGIDPNEYRGFAWGGGVERLVMLHYGIEDLRHFESGKLAFLKEFS